MSGASKHLTKAQSQKHIPTEIFWAHMSNTQPSKTNQTCCLSPCLDFPLLWCFWDVYLLKQTSCSCKYVLKKMFRTCFFSSPFSLYQGERLSHAVGCAFAACLERKQRREKECGVTASFDASRTSFVREGSFRINSSSSQQGGSSERDDKLQDKKKGKSKHTE